MLGLRLWLRTSCDTDVLQGASQLFFQPALAMDALSPSDGFRLKSSGSVYLHLKTAIRIQEYVYYYLAKMVKNPPS